MNRRWELFADGLLKGMEQGKAYRDAGYADRAGADASATRLVKSTAFVAYLNERRKSMRLEELWPIHERIGMLVDIARNNKDDDPKVAMIANDQMSKIVGSYTQDKQTTNDAVTPTINITIADPNTEK